VKLKPKVCRYHHEARRKEEAIEQKSMRHEMETANKQENRASWSNQQQAFTLPIIPTKATCFFRLAQSSYSSRASLFQADLFSIL